MMGAKISFRTENGVIENHKFSFLQCLLKSNERISDIG